MNSGYIWSVFFVKCYYITIPSNKAAIIEYLGLDILIKKEII